MASAVRDNKALSRFELDSNGATAVANYQLGNGVITISHTETPVAARGQGIASRLVAGTLEIVRARGLKVIRAVLSCAPICKSIPRRTTS